MTLRTRLTRMLGIEHPILLAPMGSISGGRLAASVSEAGGLGIIGGGYGDPDWLAREQAAAGNARVGSGFITWSLARQPATLERALAASPPAVMLSFGDAAPFIAKIKDAGAKAICQVQSLAQARLVLDQGADIIVAQGTEAGGHGGARATLPLVPAIADVVAACGREAAVVAAGGIMDGRGLAAALMLGADGVLMGSRFYAAEESLAAPAAKARVVAGSGDDTLRTTVFDVARGLDWPAAYTGRALANAFSRRWHGREAALAAAQAAEGARYADAVARADFDTAVVFTGEGIDLIRGVEPAGAIVARLMREAETLLARRFA
jgi:nitronate monooxygenase